MKYKNILIAMVVILAIVIANLFLIVSQYNQNRDELVRSKVNDININIDKLDELENLNNLSDAFILLTEIKQDSKMIVDIYAYSERKNDKAIALGDLLGYTYYYIDNIEPEKVNKESLTKNISELVQVNDTFSRVIKANLKNQENYLELFKNELERNIERHPQNTILKNMQIEN